jgi:hypothetical protein
LSLDQNRLTSRASNRRTTPRSTTATRGLDRGEHVGRGGGAPRRGRVDPAARALDRGGEPLGSHGLHEVVHRVELERAHGVLVVGGDEDDGRQVRVARGQREAVEAGELDVEHHQIGGELGDAGERGIGVDRLAGDGDAIDRGEHANQAAPRRVLVVDDEDLHAVAASRSGSSRRT